MNGLTNLEYLISNLLSFYTKQSAMGRVTTTTDFVPLSNTSIPAQVVYISNTSGEVLQVSLDNGTQYFELPNNSVFPFQNIQNLQGVFVKTANGTSGARVTFLYLV